MSKFIRIIAFILFATQVHLYAVIFESKDLQDIYRHLDTNPKHINDTLVVFDIDHTIAQNPPGLSHWLDYKVAELEKKGLSKKEAFDIALHGFFTITHSVELTPLSNSPTIIADLQSKGIHIIGLTNRSFPIMQRTPKQLSNIGISFVPTCLYDKDMDLNITHRGIYSQGIIFTGNNNKGEMLFLFLNNIGYIPKKIIFVDDYLIHVKCVEVEAEKHGVEFVGLRFGLLDDEKKCPAELIEEKMYELKVQLGIEPLG